ncbi:hypothetical protein GQ600_20448 [Phytophthora cactorum]|nr:hypothetical protein GQ600_20448 [Phytophthora cactorum]
MVCVTLPPQPTLNSRTSTSPCRDQNEEVIHEYFRCRCGTARQQTHRNGYSTLMQHVLREHSDYDVVMVEETAAQTGSILNFIRHSSQNLFGWMVDCRVESVTFLFYSYLDLVSEERLRAGMDVVVVAVERSLASELPARFEVMLDSWTHTITPATRSVAA